MYAEIIAIGTELLTPHKQDTNSLFLTGHLNRLGIEVAFKTVVGDRHEHLLQVTKAALRRTGLVILMGGLGPTEDDLTREIVAEALGLGLQRNQDIAADLHARFAARRIKMPENNLRQADVLDGAEWLYNPRGSAPGQFLMAQFEGAEKMVALLPGPPFELEPMFLDHVFPKLEGRVPRQHIYTRVLKIAMMPESECDARVSPLYKKYPDVETTILAGAGNVELHLKAKADSLEQAEARAMELSHELEDELDESVYSTGGESLEQIVGYYLQMRGATLAVAESCTGGMLAERITSVPGSSRYFLGGATVYSNDLKTLFADIPPLMIREHGAVSKEVAAALAENIRDICKTTIGVGITGVAGPGGGTDAKPVGLVYHAISDGSSAEVVERKFPGDRTRIRFWASQQALDMIRRKLLKT